MCVGFVVCACSRHALDFKILFCRSVKGVRVRERRGQPMIGKAASANIQNHTRPNGLTYRIRGNCWYFIIIFSAKRYSKYTLQVVYGSVPGWCPHCRCRYRHHTFMCQIYHLQHTPNQCNLDRLKRYFWCNRNGARRSTDGQLPGG